MRGGGYYKITFSRGQISPVYIDTGGGIGWGTSGNADKIKKKLNASSELGNKGYNITTLTGEDDDYEGNINVNGTAMRVDIKRWNKKSTYDARQDMLKRESGPSTQQKTAYRQVDGTGEAPATGDGSYKAAGPDQTRHNFGHGAMGTKDGTYMTHVSSSGSDTGHASSSGSDRMSVSSEASVGGRKRKRHTKKKRNRSHKKRKRHKKRKSHKKRRH